MSNINAAIDATLFGGGESLEYRDGIIWDYSQPDPTPAYAAVSPNLVAAALTELNRIHDQRYNANPYGMGMLNKRFNGLLEILKLFTISIQTGGK